MLTNSPMQGARKKTPRRHSGSMRCYSIAFMANNKGLDDTFTSLRRGMGLHDCGARIPSEGYLSLYCLASATRSSVGRGPGSRDWLAQPLPPPRQRLGKSQPQCPRVLETRLHPPHAATHRSTMSARARSKCASIPTPNEQIFADEVLEFRSALSDRTAFDLARNTSVDRLIRPITPRFGFTKEPLRIAQLGFRRPGKHSFAGL